MNPISQRLLGIGALLGFASTFIAGAPVTGEGSLHLLIRAISGGLIFGTLGLLVGQFLHTSVVIELEREVESIILEKNRRKQDKLHAAAEQNQAALEAQRLPEDMDAQNGVVELRTAEAE